MFPVRLQKSIPPFLLSLVVFLLLLSPSQLSPGGISQANMVSLWHRHASEGKMERFPHVPPFPLKEQEAIRGYIAEHIPSSSRLYYHVFFMPEMSTISGRVFYPVERYDLVKDTLHKNAPAYLITGPQQQGELSKVADDYLPNLIAERCAKIVYQNPSHTLCQLK